MSRRVTRLAFKTYIRIPDGEIQYGHLTGRVVMWFRGKRYTIVPMWKA